MMTEKLMCKRCEWVWDYNGKKKVNPKYPQYTPCPRCHTPVKLGVKKID
jgi:hypothetical protein